ncbi:DUF427 domain-containing protein [Conexibacter arvalis]|uniref:Uncharacterized protein (DUF427 family) n=1 Tax=Conexibacter arvalis TaxID=912552 RepID=A0A840I950_9ACTN|nr:DUF427 domain-containing protein [Conexibacter arvalis]MBB4660664.1 uncharacterized protein (DUF427 family) [Conexibacter arvalis]
MSLTIGSGPFGQRPAGRFNVEIPAGELLFVEPSPRWVRALRGGETVIDSRRAKLLHRHGALARYFVPRDDVRWERLADLEPVAPPAGAPGLDGHVSFAWDDLDAWFEEDERLVAHAIDPYHRIDVRPTSRHVVVSAGGVVLADARHARALFETGLPTRWYLARADVLAELEPSPLRTECAYKGVASYFSARVGGELLENVAWTYRRPRHDALAVRDLICFFDEAVDVDLDGERQPRPETPWGRPGWWRDYDEAR